MYTTTTTLALTLTAFLTLLQPTPAPIIPDLMQNMFGGGASKRSDTTSTVSQCISSFQAATERVHISGTTVVMEGVPASCMAEAKAWNEHPHAKLLEKDYGVVKVLNESAVRFEGLPAKTLDLIKGAVTES